MMKTNITPLFLIAALLLGPAAVQAEALSVEQQKHLWNLLLQDCGSCHGMTMNGGLGPALLPSRMAELGLDNIKAAIKYGRPGTAMPPWEAQLTNAEIDYIANVLLKGVAE